MIEFFETLYTEMTKGNFSFAILVVSVVQVVLMIIERKKKP